MKPTCIPITPTAPWYRVPTEFCCAGVCFIPLDANTPRLFGLPEFLAGLALMVRRSVTRAPVSTLTFRHLGVAPDGRQPTLTNLR